MKRYALPSPKRLRAGRSKTFPISPLVLCENRFFHTFSVMGSSNTNVPLYPSLASFSCRGQAKRGKGRFYQHNFKIPLYPPLPKGDKNTRNWWITRRWLPIEIKHTLPKCPTADFRKNSTPLDNICQVKWFLMYLERLLHINHRIMEVIPFWLLFFL